MAIGTRDLRAAATRARQSSIAQSMSEAISRSEHTAFLCHSHRDEALALGLQVLLREHGWKLYIDWQDSRLPEAPDKVTAEAIKARIKQTQFFLFLATSNSTSSKWCPWEIGFADATKIHDAILVVPTTDDMGHLHGSEYLELYRHVDVTTTARLAAFAAGQRTNGVLVEHLR